MIRSILLLTLSCMAAMSCAGISSAQQESFIYSGSNAINVSSEESMTLGGVGLHSIGNPGVPLETPRQFDVSFGFLYLRPIFANSGLRILDNSPASLLLGAQNDLNAEFTFIPRLAAVYQLEQSEWGVGASAEYFNIIGSLRREISSNDPEKSGVLNATNRFRLLSVNLGELIKTVALEDYADEERKTIFNHPLLTPMRLTFTFGPRIVFLDQYYAASLNTAQPSNVTASQEFSGIGINGSIWADRPIGDSLEWSVYSGVRGSILLGQNNRSSDLSGQKPNSQPEPPTIPYTLKLTENKSMLMPIGELEMGISYVSEDKKIDIIGNEKRSRSYFVRVGVNGQIWGGAGYINSQDQGNFRDRALYLVGFTVLAGMQY